MPPLVLPDVTLVCVDTRHPALGLFALDHARARARFAASLLFTDPAHVAGTARGAAEGIRVLPATIDSIAAYSHFMHRGLAEHVHSTHALVVQWDGLISDTTRWDPTFLDWDYIGAPWPDAGSGRRVGNGGFSLRSRRLLQALLDPQLRIGHPEDLSICVENRARLEQRHGIRIAPLQVAERFAYERTEPPAPTFGFHGLHNLHREMTAEQVERFLRDLPAELTRHKEAVDLCRALIGRGRFDAAALLLAKRRSIGLYGGRTLRLMARLALARMRRR